MIHEKKKYIMTSSFGTRTYLEFCVGNKMAVECVLHLRRADLKWFHRHDHHRNKGQKNNNDEDDNSNNNEEDQASSSSGNPLFDEIMELLQTSILPRMFSNEIEMENAKQNRKKPSPELGPGGIPVISGEKNHDQQQRKAAGGNNKGRKRKRLTKKQLADLEREKEKLEQRKKKDIYYAFGRRGGIKLAYRLQDRNSNPAETLLYDDDDIDSNNRKKKAGKFRTLTKLSKRVLIWCYPSSGKDDDDDMMDTGTLVRPEFIPMASIFRRSQEGKQHREGG